MYEAVSGWPVTGPMRRRPTEPARASNWAYRPQRPPPPPRWGCRAGRRTGRGTVGVAERLETNDGQVLVTEACLKVHIADTVERYLADEEVSARAATSVRGGAQLVRALGLSSDALSAVTGVRGDSTRERNARWNSSPPEDGGGMFRTDALSERQREVYELARRRDY